MGILTSWGLSRRSTIEGLNGTIEAQEQLLAEARQREAELTKEIGAKRSKIRKYEIETACANDALDDWKAKYKKAVKEIADQADEIAALRPDAELWRAARDKRAKRRTA